MVEEGDEIDEVNKTAEDMVKRGSVLHDGGEDPDSRRQDGISEANLLKSNCK